MDAAAIAILQKVRAPYSVDALSQKLALDALANSKKMQAMVKKILAEKEKLAAKLWELGLIVFPSDANFLLVRFPAEVSASRVQKNLLEKFGIVVRDFSHKKFLENCVRITVGNPNENEELLRALRSFKDLSSK
jgi:histidinol-phosphate aminotransferase